MGILDSLENSAAFKGALGRLEAAVIPVVLSEVLGNGSQGGLNAIVAKLQVDQLARVLAQQLPTAVDHASPDGKLPHTV
jgi:uncharacterized protein YidB (DUF937 family)